jgi:2-C-methyl-D-erythritol 4-phosphate cytidylyltransferase/2-C-methyl-D-erythritol 2,4-cyclodiphosphate synthase
MMIEKVGEKITPVDIGKHNVKITTAEDILFAEYILERRSNMNEIRIGHGYDVHRLVPDRRLILGGVDIPFEKGLLGHSDADVLVHAIMDAILGACALGDIGRHFPDNDEEYRGVSSLELLRRVNVLIKNNGYSVVNIDATIVAEQPKIAQHIEKMIYNISQILTIEPSRINIKATTEESLGFTGRKEGISAYAVASVKK